MTSSFQTIHNKVFNALNAEPQKTNNIKVEIQGNQFWIIFNRQKRMNTFTMDMYLYFTQLIRKANQMSEIKYIVVTANGKHFSAGNDLNNFTHPFLMEFQENQRPIIIRIMADMLKQLGSAIIDSSKPIFALIQGNVVGFAFTQLALYDKVFAVDDCNFFAPLVKIAQGPQMCSSYTFPKFFGRKMAEQLIIQGRTIKAIDLQSKGFLERFQSFQLAKIAICEHMKNLDDLQWMSYVTARQLFRQPERQLLHRINKKECDNLVQRWQNPKLVEFLMEYMAKQKEKRKTK